MLSKWPIRNKLLIGIGLLLVIVATLSWSGFHGVYAYRSLVQKSQWPGHRASAGRGAERAGQRFARHRRRRCAAPELPGPMRHRLPSSIAPRWPRRSPIRLQAIRATLAAYREQLLVNDRGRLGDHRQPRANGRPCARSTPRWTAIVEASRTARWIADPARLESIHVELERLQNLSVEVAQLPASADHDFAGEVRIQYRALIIVTWITTLSATLLLGLFIRLFYTWVFRPLRVLVKGSRRVAAGEFGYRIALDTHDEMSELADAMNDMTARFQAIRDDLDRQVQERTKQVVRSEQLASVGFLAAGVAHEINNPLASIALCAESLEGRMHEMLDAQCEPRRPISDVDPQLSADDSERGLPLQRNHRAAARLLAHGRRQRARTPTCASWCRA